ncbi:DNA polymerase III subunit delta [Lyngbya sp. CCAP 1446/10]|uniref:DNA polymerase III subunit delta n=1 Tax=Lyngbya sp. CCAP 1446/10 TaxID=439293 RepID=UPI0022376206|nr:DNA polymerase III subunit delta [Lyngbya sp. CCAP 1446/10]MCW6053239.1 DNA polymerase III subunit delta [Lyngbya sp. CCAP 1446/10]
MIYILIGNDTYAIAREVEKCKTQTHPLWRDFNIHRFDASSLDAALSAAASVPFGGGSKLIVVENCDFKQFGETGLELLQILPQLPTTTHLVFTAGAIDKRLKVVKHLLQFGQLKEFTLIPPWRTDLIESAIANTVKQMNLSIARDAVSYLAVAIGNDSARRVSELEKLAIYTDGERITKEAAKALVPATTASSFQLAEALLKGQAVAAIKVLDELLSRAEFPLAIIATLQTQFKTWLWVKATLNSGQQRSDSEIASMCGISNPKRLYFLKQEVKEVSANFLSRSLSILFDLEIALKTGDKPDSMLPALLRITQLNQLK